MSAEELRPEVAMWVPTCEVARAVGVDEKTVAIDWDGCPVYRDDL